MPSPRSLRRQNPITFVLAGILCIGFFIFFFSSNDSAAVSSGPGRTSSSVLSPPSLPFRKAKANEPQSAPPVEHYYMNNVTQSRNPAENKEKVLILTPLARFYQAYWDNLNKIAYPHDLISIGFIIPKTKEGNQAYADLQKQVTKTQSGPKAKRFASITILRQDTENPLVSQNEAERHKMEHQKARRSAMAKARNSLLFTTLGPATSWVLWLDADIVEFPPTLIQDLADYDAPILAPNCFQRYYNNDKKAMDVRPYDYNNWIDSSTARELGAKMGKDDILLEGYAEMPTYRTLMAMMHDPSADPGTKIKLDGVGGAALLVKADVHRDGAMFPPFAFYHLIETEGFAKMAKRLNWDSYGLPNYLVSVISTHIGAESDHCRYTTITSRRSPRGIHFAWTIWRALGGVFGLWRLSTYFLHSKRVCILSNVSNMCSFLFLFTSCLDPPTRVARWRYNVQLLTLYSNLPTVVHDVKLARVSIRCPPVFTVFPKSCLTSSVKRRFATGLDHPKESVFADDPTAARPASMYGCNARARAAYVEF